MTELKQLYEAILNGDEPLAKTITQEALDQGEDPETLVQQFMIPAMDEIGTRFENNECFVPELLISSRAMKGALALIQPKLKDKGAEPAGRVVIGTVSGDLHDIGKNLVAAMLEGGGYEVIDLGVDVAAEKFIATVDQQKPNIIAMSALLTTTMPTMKQVIQGLQSKGMRDKVKVIIGGAPITDRFCQEIGADGYSDNAAGAVKLARKLL